MLTRLTAVLLVSLIVSPMTAPFHTLNSDTADEVVAQTSSPAVLLTKRDFRSSEQSPAACEVMAVILSTTVAIPFGRAVGEAMPSCCALSRTGDYRVLATVIRI